MSAKANPITRGNRSERLRLDEQLFAAVEFPAFEYSPTLTSIANEGAIGFFGSALKSARRREHRFGIFRQMSRTAARAIGKDQEAYKWVGVYGEWSAKRHAELARQADDYPPIDTSIILQLGQSGDPGVLLISFLEKTRIAKYPDFDRISHFEKNDREGTPGIVFSDLALLYGDYEAMLRSIHGPAIEGLGKRAVAGF